MAFLWWLFLEASVLSQCAAAFSLPSSSSQVFIFLWFLVFCWLSMVVKVLFFFFSAEASFAGDFPVPPPYSVATSLPTYDEAEKAKAAAMAASAVEVIPRVRGRSVAAGSFPSLVFPLWSNGSLFVYCSQDDDFPPRDDFSDADQLRVGNDGIFMLAFFSEYFFWSPVKLVSLVSSFLITALFPKFPS